MSLEVGEAALKISGTGAKHQAVMLYAVLKEKKKTKGRVRLETLVKSGRPLTVFSVKDIVAAEPEQMPDEKGAFFKPEEGCIYVRKGMSAQEIFQNLVPELVFAGYADGNPHYDKNEDAFHVSCASYMLCKKYGMDTSRYNFLHAPEFFEKMETHEVRVELSRARDAANAISARIGKKPNRQRESNVAHQAKAKAERWAANDGHKYPKRICEQCGKEFYPNSTRQRFCNTDCTKAHQQAEKEKKRFAEKGEHTFRQKVCKICGKPFWPSNGQEVLCSEECKTINRNQRQLAYYYRKQSGQKAGEAI